MALEIRLHNFNCSRIDDSNGNEDSSDKDVNFKL